MTGAPSENIPKGDQPDNFSLRGVRYVCKSGEVFHGSNSFSRFFVLFLAPAIRTGLFRHNAAKFRQNHRHGHTLELA